MGFHPHGTIEMLLKPYGTNCSLHVKVTLIFCQIYDFEAKKKKKQEIDRSYKTWECYL